MGKMTNKNVRKEEQKRERNTRRKRRLMIGEYGEDDKEESSEGRTE